MPNKMLSLIWLMFALFVQMAIVTTGETVTEQCCFSQKSWFLWRRWHRQQRQPLHVSATTTAAINLFLSVSTYSSERARFAQFLLFSVMASNLFVINICGEVVNEFLSILLWRRFGGSGQLFSRFSLMKIDSIQDTDALIPFSPKRLRFMLTFLPFYSTPTLYRE